MPGDLAWTGCQYGGQPDSQVGDQEGEQVTAHGLSIPDTYWSVRPIPATGEGEQPERLLLRGAVLVRILGHLEAAELELTEEGRLEALPQDLRAALTEPSYRPESEVWRALKQDGLLTPAILAVSLLATVGVLVEALFFLGVIQIGQNLTTPAQRIAAISVLLLFVLVPLFLEYPISTTVLRMGRRLKRACASPCWRRSPPGRPLFPQPPDFGYEPAPTICASCAFCLLGSACCEPPFN
jgi:hypothetical protein